MSPVSKKKLKKKKQSSLHSLIKSRKYFGLFSIIIILFVGFIIFIKFELKPVIETGKTEVSKIPKDVEKTLKKAGTPERFRIPILMYHYVEYVQDKKDTIRESLNIYPDVLDQQIKTLQDDGYTFITASELADILNHKGELPQKPILLTFDDGHWDLYTNVLPILEKYHVKATAYIISGFIGGSDFLTKDQLQKVIQSGLVEIGAHTVHHIGLAKRFLTLVKYEVNASKKQLENNYHIKVISFAYPSGLFDEQAIKVVKEAGFKTSVSTIPGIEQNIANRFFLYRIRPGYRTGEMLLEYLKQEQFRPW